MSFNLDAVVTGNVESLDLNLRKNTGGFKTHYQVFISTNRQRNVISAMFTMVTGGRARGIQSR